MIKTTVEDIMTEHIVKVTEDNTIRQVAHILLRFRVNGLIVVNGKEKNKVTGVVTTTDLLRIFDDVLSDPDRDMTAFDEMGDMPVGKIANKEVVMVSPDTTVEEAVSIMHQRNIHTLPVFDGDELVGIVGKHDILNIVFYSEDD
jgi:CBS domain-containing protein